MGIAMFLFLLEAIKWPKEVPISLGWLGMFFAVLAVLVR